MSWLATQAENVPETNASGRIVEIPAANYKIPDTTALSSSDGAGSSIGTGQFRYVLEPLKRAQAHHEKAALRKGPDFVRNLTYEDIDIIQEHLGSVEIYVVHL